MGAGDADRQADAEGCFRRAAALGSATAMFDMGNTAGARPSAREDVAAYEDAIAGGETDAWLNLGNVLINLGDWPQGWGLSEPVCAAGRRKDVGPSSYFDRMPGGVGHCRYRP